MQVPSKEAKPHSPGNVTLIHWSNWRVVGMIFVWATKCEKKWIHCQYFKTNSQHCLDLVELAVLAQSAHTTITRWITAAPLGWPCALQLDTGLTAPYCLVPGQLHTFAARSRAPADIWAGKLFFTQRLTLKWQNWWWDLHSHFWSPTP